MASKLKNATHKQSQSKIKMGRNQFWIMIFLRVLLSLTTFQVAYAQADGNQMPPTDVSVVQGAASSITNNDASPGHAHPEEPNNAIILFAMVLMFSLYFSQGYIAYRSAERHLIKINGSNRNILDIAFSGIEALTTTWIFSIGIVGAPFLLSFFSAMPRSHLIGSNSHLAVANTFHSAIIALIMVLITVELTLIVKSRVIISPVEAGRCSEPGM